MGEKQINFDLDDPRADKLAEALSNKTCKKIIGLLAEKNMNATEISSALKLPLNTIGYNLEKLTESGLIEKSKGFFWSVKGRKIETYKLSNKRIVISPKKIGLSVIPVILISGIAGLLIKFLLSSSYQSIAEKKVYSEASDLGQEVASISLSNADKTAYRGYDLLVSFGQDWFWFLLGAIVGMVIFLIWNRRKIWG